MKNEILTSTLLTGLEAIQKFNKSIKIDKKNKEVKDLPNTFYINITGSEMILNSIQWDAHQIVFNANTEDSEALQAGVIGLDTIIKALKKFNDFTYVKMENDKLILTDNKKKVELKTVKYQEVKTIDFSVCASNKINGIEFKTAFDKVKKTVATDETRPTLTGIHFKDSFIESVDGYRISQIRLNNADFDSFIAKPFYIDIIASIAKKNKLDIEILSTDKNSQFMTRGSNYNLFVNCSLIEGEFLKTEQVFTGNHDFNVVIDFEDVKEIKSECEFLGDMLINEDGTKSPVIFDITKDRFELSCNTDGTTTKSSIEDFRVNDYNMKDDFKIAFNNKYLLDVLKNIENDKKFTIGFISKLTPMILLAENEKYLVLPIRMPA